MLITTGELSAFTGTYPETSEDNTKILSIIIGSATEIINNYLMFDCEEESENNPFWNSDEETLNIPSTVQFVCLEIASLLQMESSNNLGINSKSFDSAGSRTFLNVVDYTKYLTRLSAYRKVLAASDDE